MDKDKEQYFRDLYSLKDDSDEDEEDTSNAKDVLRKSKPPRSSSPITFQSTSKGRQQATDPKKISAIFRPVSEPIPGALARKPLPVSRNNSLLRHNTSPLNFSSPNEVDTSSKQPNSSNEKPQSSKDKKTELVRSVSTPNIGSVIMKNSSGINSMLRGKRKRKDSVVKSVPENQRIFAGQVFYYIPPDKIAPLRKAQIEKAQSYGATWTKEWNSAITHVIVDKRLKLNEVLEYLKPMIKSDALPPNIILVKEYYPIECTQFRSLLDPNQKRYIVDRLDTEPKAEEIVRNAEPNTTESQASNKSLKVKEAKARERDLLKKTPIPSQNSTQPEINIKDSLRGAQFPGQVSEEPTLMENPRDFTSVNPDPSKLHDELHEMIEMTRQFGHLPLDDEEEEDERSSSSDDLVDSGSEEDEAVARAPKRKYSRKRNYSQDNFSCVTGGTGIILESNPNRETIEILQEMADYYDKIRDQWRSRAYRRAIGTLKKQTVKVATYDHAKSLPTIGHRLAEKIEEIVLTHRLRRLDYAKLEPQDQILQLFLQIYDVGLSQASKWVYAGYKTLEDLKTKAHLTPNQRLGVEHFDDLNTRIPREEVTALGEIVKKAIAEIDPQVESIIGGSYRRGAATSGDIDFILTRPGTKSSRELLPFLHQLTSSLTTSGFLVAALAIPRRQEGSKWHGACVLSSSPSAIWRRIDFLLVPDNEIGAALIYFTGDDIFNRSIRLLSSTKGWCLNQRGLYRDVMRGPGRVKVNEGSLIEGQDERKIFEILGVPWRPPEQRICH